ncbi:hypothetical protein, partial [Micromonospora sp.]|uniref:hypothetical protein n=1 Tax=Micromonospora sp. TaxID=1876 RepID=UPI003B3BE12D
RGGRGRGVAGRATFVAFYLGTVRALGLSRVDLLVLRTLARRRRRGDPSDATGDAPGVVPSDGPPPSGVGGGGRDTSGRVVSR